MGEQSGRAGYCCLDCQVAVEAVRVGAFMQCPRCGSRAVWPVTGWEGRAVVYEFPTAKKVEVRHAHA